MKRIALLCCAVFGLAGVFSAGTAAGQATGQVSDTLRVFSSTPTTRVVTAGGVRIRSVHDNRRRIYIVRPQPVVNAAGADAAPATPAPNTSPIITRQDLNRLELRLIQQVETILLQARPLVPDTVYANDRAGRPGDALPPPDGAAGRPLTNPGTTPVGGTPTVEQVERDILETGLFRAADVNFAFNKATLLPSAMPTLDAVGEVMRQYPALRVEVAGHTDDVGSDAYNRQLSEARAMAVRDYLNRQYGLDAGQLVSRGYGEARPVGANTTPTGRAQNRRVEFVVLNPEVAERYTRTVRERTPAQDAAPTQEAAPTVTPDTLAAAIQRTEQRLLDRIDALERMLRASRGETGLRMDDEADAPDTDGAARPPRDRTEAPAEAEENVETVKRGFVGVRPVTGFNFDQPYQVLFGVRAEFRRGYRLMPEVLFGLGDNAGLTTTINANVAIPVGFRLLDGFDPYVGTGIGFLNNDAGLELVLNLFAGVERPFGFGTLFFEFVTLDLFDANRLLVGYRLDF